MSIIYIIGEKTEYFVDCVTLTIDQTFEYKGLRIDKDKEIYMTGNKSLENTDFSHWLYGLIFMFSLMIVFGFLIFAVILAIIGLCIIIGEFFFLIELLPWVALFLVFKYRKPLVKKSREFYSNLSKNLKL